MVGPDSTGHNRAARTRAIARRLLVWYDRHRRDLPWRPPFEKTKGAWSRPDPYAVWISEIMLQQTTVATVTPRFARFLARWPRVEDLAAAPLDDVLHEWQGLGYYARARNLHRAAKAVRDEWGGKFPDNEKDLRAIPGVGPYTAAAIAAFAFGRRTMPVDGNIERVTSRLFDVRDLLPRAKKRIEELAAALAPARRAGDVAQALMDLGAGPCRPSDPDCAHCPLDDLCLGNLNGSAFCLPRRAQKPTRPKRHAIAFCLRREDGAVLLRRRPEKGLLGGLIELPSSEWRDAPFPASPGDKALSALAANVLGKTARRAVWRMTPGTLGHMFTHFALETRVCVAEAPRSFRPPAGGFWCAPGEFQEHALATLTKKLLRHVRVT